MVNILFDSPTSYGLTQQNTIIVLTLYLGVCYIVSCLMKITLRALFCVYTSIITIF